MVQYTLHYFNGRGRAEISRLIFAAAGVEFNDNRIFDWPQTKSNTPIGQLPYLEIDDTKLPQSLSIARYLAREYNLVGDSNLDAAKCDSIVDTCIDLMTAFYNKVFLVADASAKEIALKKFLEDDVIKGLTNTETLIQMYSVNGHSVGSRLTWADLFIYEVTFTLLRYDPNALNNFSKIRKVREIVEQNTNVSNYLKSRPETPF